nr:unnamed protein product [Callosobruchus chinensis]
MDSDDYSTDDSRKRKVLGEKEDDPFGRSSKIIRTPSKAKSRTDEKLDSLIDLVKEMKSEMHEMRLDQKRVKEDIAKMMQENLVLRQENQELKKENKEIRDRLDEVNDRVEWLEKEKRKKNAVVTGVNMDTTQAADLKEYMQDIFKNLLAVDVQVKSTQKLGSRACLVEFEKEEDKEKLMKNKHKPSADLQGGNEVENIVPKLVLIGSKVKEKIEKRSKTRLIHSECRAKSCLIPRTNHIAFRDWKR